MDPVETLEYKGYEIKIFRDDDSPESPREWDNLGEMVCFHSNYTLGDKHKYTQEELVKIIKRKDVIALPLFLYDHSGITMSTGKSYPFDCPWDSGQVGYIFVTYENIKKEYSKKRVSKALRQKIEKYLEGEVETYDNYITGNVYGYRIEDSKGNNLDGCWGFFGYDNEKSGLLESAHDAIDCHDTEQKEQHTKKLKALIKNHVPLEHREKALA